MQQLNLLGKIITWKSKLNFKNAHCLIELSVVERKNIENELYSMKYQLKFYL